MKKIFIVILVIVIILGGVYKLYKKGLPFLYNDLEVEPFNNINQFNNFLKDRYILYNDNEIIVGKNKNEVENGYFDVVIKVNHTILEITLNKIFKSFDEKYNNIFFSNKYYNDIFDFILYLGFNVTNEAKDKCMEEYINLRTSFGSYNIDKYSIENVDIFTKDNMLFLNIHK